MEPEFSDLIIDWMPHKYSMRAQASLSIRKHVLIVLGASRWANPLTHNGVT